MRKSIANYDMIDYCIYEKCIGARNAVYTDYPQSLSGEIIDYLKSVGIEKLYVHQASMFVEAEKHNTVITTSTASGKTLSFLLPVMQAILKDPTSRAIFIYPTKALASDQMRSLQSILSYFGNRVKAGIYDGDTPVDERVYIRNHANIILTNPEMLNYSFLPKHRRFSRLFSNLKYIVIDELHIYRGAFGSHLANIIRRIGRVCRYYSSDPLFLCSSATINNPLELAEGICGKTFVQISNDGSPAPERRYHFIQPPEIGLSGTGGRVPISTIATQLIPKLIQNDRSFITFCKSRASVEIVLKESREKLKALERNTYDYSRLIFGYRAGYHSEERKDIEKKMVTGVIKGLVATNALELGIDIGSVDSVILTGFPRTIASFYQQSGRAGRKGAVCDTFLILDNQPMDQFLAVNPEWLFDADTENAVIDKDNVFIQIAHIRAAAAELPLQLDDYAVFPDLSQILTYLLEKKEIVNSRGAFFGVVRIIRPVILD